MKSNILKTIAIVVVMFIIGGIQPIFGQKPDERCQAVKDLYSINESSGKVTLSRIINVSGKSAWDIYILMETLLKTEALNAYYEITAKEAVNHTIHARGAYNAYYKKNKSSKLGIGCMVYNNLQIEVKDEKVKVTMTLNRYRNDLINANVTSVYPFNNKENLNKLTGGMIYATEANSISKIHASKYFNAAVTTGNELLDSIERKLSEKKADW